MGHFGFSYIGLCWLLMLFIPNLFWTKHRPEGYTSAGENRILSLFEKTGQVLVTTSALIFSDFNIRPAGAWLLWLAASYFCMLMYEAFWLRYFKSKKCLEDFYCSFCGIPLAGAVLPVVAFFLLGIYGKNIWMLLSSLILGIGHIGIHRQHYRNSLTAQKGSRL